jgi:hypothetical protein
VENDAVALPWSISRQIADFHGPSAFINRIAGEEFTGLVETGRADADVSS